MTGIVVSGVGIGGLVAPPVLSRLIIVYDWRLSYVIMAVIVLIVMLVAAQFMRRDPAQKGLLPYGEVLNGGKQRNIKFETKSFSLKEAAHSKQFWLFFINSMLAYRSG